MKQRTYKSIKADVQADLLKAGWTVNPATYEYNYETGVGRFIEVGMGETKLIDNGGIKVKHFSLEKVENGWTVIAVGRTYVAKTLAEATKLIAGLSK